MTAEQPPTAEHWLTYAGAADRLGLTPEAVRALARRQHWPRRSPNAVGGQTWILVPADRLEATVANGHAENGRRHGRRDNTEILLVAAVQNGDGQGAPADTGEHIDHRAPADTDAPDRRINEILTAVRGVREAVTHATRDALNESNKDVIVALQEAITTLRVELYAQRDRADAAERRAQAAGARVQELLARRWWQWWR